MGKIYDSIDEKLAAWIGRQRTQFLLLVRQRERDTADGPLRRCHPDS